MWKKKLFVDSVHNNFLHYFFAVAFKKLLCLLAQITLLWKSTVSMPSREDPLHNNHVIDNVLKTLNKFANETMQRNHELFCKKQTYKTDVAIGYVGCASYVVEQAFCVGQCSTVYVPGKSSGALSCSMCGVKKRKIKTVKLICQSGIRRVDIPIVEECGCKTCKVNNKIPEGLGWIVLFSTMLNTMKPFISKH